jgi:hypothetical protein
MRTTLLLLPMILWATGASAQSPQALHIPPAAADKVANALDAVTDALLDLPVGRVQAAIEGRAPAPGEQQMTVRDLERRDDPNFERDLHRHIAEARPMVRQSLQAVNDALPQVMQGLQQAGRALERATANMPDPTYPRR